MAYPKTENVVAPSQPLYGPHNDSAPLTTMSTFPRQMSRAPGAEIHDYRRNLLCDSAVVQAGRAQLQFGWSPIVGQNSAENFPKVGSFDDMLAYQLEAMRMDMTNRNLQLSDMRGSIFSLAQDQQGSRYIQDLLEVSSPFDVQMVFDELIATAPYLINNVFGNYVVQRFLEMGTAEQITTLVHCITFNFQRFVYDQYGCRVVQKALDVVPVGHKLAIIAKLHGHVIECMVDQNGNHVLQKCVETVDPVHLQFMVNETAGRVVELCEDSFGCRVIQRIVEHFSPQQVAPIMEELLTEDNLNRLICNQYGNYVIQHVLQYCSQEARTFIIMDVVKPIILSLSQQKFSSNVVEKCVLCATPEQREQLLMKIMSYNDL